MDNLSKKLEPRSVDAVTTAQTKNFGGRSEVKIVLGQNFIYTGVDFKQEGADGARQREVLTGMMAGNTFVDDIWLNSTISSTGLFGEYHLNIHENYFVAASRFELNSAKSRNEDNKFQTAASPLSATKLNTSVSLGYTKAISTNISLGYGWKGPKEWGFDRKIHQLPACWCRSL